MNMKSILNFFTVLVAMCVSVSAFAQVSVKGTIKDGNDTPIPGATVVEVGTSNGQVADADGTIEKNDLID